MSIRHPVFLRKVGNGKVMVITIMDDKTLGLTDEHPCDNFVIAQSSCHVLTANRPTITLKSGIIPSEKYVNDINERGLYVEHTRGMGLNGIVTNPFWAIQQVQTVEEMMGL